MFDVILVPIDRSISSEIALTKAAAMASVFSARLILLHVVDIVGWANPTYSVNPLDWQIRKAEAEAYLQARTSQLLDQGLQAEWHMLEGDAAEQTLEFVRTHAVDLVVLGARGQSPVKEWSLGSVAAKITQHARTSFLLVRLSTEDPGSSVASDGPSHQRVLLPLDGSPRAECVLPVAAALARNHRGPLTLAHVVRRPEMPRRTPPTQEESALAHAIIEANVLEAERYLSELQDRLPGEVDHRVLLDSDPVYALHQLSVQAHCDLILLSAHGYANQAEWPFGTLTARLITHGATSVFVVRDAA